MHTLAFIALRWPPTCLAAISINETGDLRPMYAINQHGRSCCMEVNSAVASGFKLIRPKVGMAKKMGVPMGITLVISVLIIKNVVEIYLEAST